MTKTTVSRPRPLFDEDCVLGQTIVLILRLETMSSSPRPWSQDQDCDLETNPGGVPFPVFFVCWKKAVEIADVFVLICPTNVVAFIRSLYLTVIERLKVCNTFLTYTAFWLRQNLMQICHGSPVPY